MSQLDLITVGIASYNRPILLARAIESVLEQSYKNLEILISDNGSDNRDVLKLIHDVASKDTRVKIFVHPTNGGPFFNFRYLLNKANGVYFVWLADDDYWSPYFVERLWAGAKKYSAALTYSQSVIVDVDLPISKSCIKQMKTTKNSIESLTSFIYFDSDAIFYGLFKTETGKKILNSLKEWNIPNFVIKTYPFLTYNFPSYPFIYGLLATGKFCNLNDALATHYFGGRDPYKNELKLGVSHFSLLIGYIFMHSQMAMRFAIVSYKARSLFGVIFAPIASLKLIARRFFVALKLRYES